MDIRRFSSFVSSYSSWSVGIVARFARWRQGEKEQAIKVELVV
jgi:hypothetical protein